MYRILIAIIFLSLSARTALSQSFLRDFNCFRYGKSGKEWSPVSKKAGNSRSNTIDILNFSINLDLTDLQNKYIDGNCRIRFTPRMNNINYIALDLLKLNVDSILYAGNTLSFSYDDTLLSVNLPTPINTGDTVEINVFYNGNPVKDLSGWGGFYFSGNYAFNLGVGFQADPHNYGRVWFPCFDNFVEHATYRFDIKTADGYKAHCNGLLLGETTINQDTIIRSWGMSDPIPTYLACVAISDYETVRDTFITPENDTIPVELAARSSDTANMNQSFINLDKAVNAFEYWYGPFEWDKVGYSLVPFSSGAMEHATNITYPRSAAGGSLSYETLMAHELSHHWWGDLATCETAGDMWINEGLASYSEHIFLEHVYGKEAYLKAIRDNHADVIQYAHVTENGYRAVTGIPHQYTYGDHVYNKGASVAHSLRGYMGDSLFRKGIRAVMNNFAFDNINSTQLQNELVNTTGLTRINDFFNDFVFQPGFAHFSIDSLNISPVGNNFEAKVFVHQKLRGATHLYNNVPLIISFYDQNRTTIRDTIWIKGQFTDSTYTLPFSPAFAALNVNTEINQAVTANQMEISSPGTYNFDRAKMEIIVDDVSDSSLVRVEHHWAKPDPIKNNSNGYLISNSRYWSVDGIFSGTFDAGARVFYDGKANSGKMDSLLVSDTEDSLILLYRESPAADWTEFRYYSKNVIGSSTNQFGLIEIDSLLPGEYTFANGESTVGINESTPEKDQRIKVFPNPTEELFTIEDKSQAPQAKDFFIYDLNGRLMDRGSFKKSSVIATHDWDAGSYLISIKSKGDPELLFSEKVAVIR